MPWFKNYIHFVWSTKNRKPFLVQKDLRVQLWQHMKENAAIKNISFDVINGHVDHCHCIVSQNVSDSPEKIIQLFKGESSWWINKNKLIKEKFEWQNDYFGIAISDTSLDAVRKYILNQEEHHKTKTFQEEYEQLMKRYG